MKGIRQTADGDWDVSDHRLTLIDGAERVKQQVRTRLRSFLGEWEFNLDYGFPWYQYVLGVKPANLNDVDNAIRDQVLSVADVTAVTALSFDFDSESRALSVTLALKTTFGDVVVEGLFP